jgi:hypothetical protein
MLLIFESTKFDNLIRRLENRPDLSAAELGLKFKQYSDRLFAEARNYGLDFAGVVSNQPPLACLRFNLRGHDVDIVLQGSRF